MNPLDSEFSIYNEETPRGLSARIGLITRLRFPLRLGFLSVVAGIVCSASAPGDISYNAKFMVIKFLDSLNLYQTSFIDSAVV